MVSQGFLGAIEQYWTIDEKPRLDRRNTYFKDKTISENISNIFLISGTTSVLAIAIISMVQVIV